VLDLISTLRTHKAAKTIRSRTDKGTLDSDIAFFYFSLSKDQRHAKHVAPLLKLVLTPKNGGASSASDVDI
jgi:hypothetical protein